MHRNKNLESIEVDYLYHLGIDTSKDLKVLFGDVKFICMGGSPDRAYEFAKKIKEKLAENSKIEPIGKTERASLYKIGNVISMSHGMGMPSILIFLHEITKLLEYAGCNDYIFIRLGTSGGIGIEPGTLVLTTEAVNNKFNSVFEQKVLGKTYSFPTYLDSKLISKIESYARATNGFVLGKTLGTDDFYEGQGRLDGALAPLYTDIEKYNYLKRAFNLNVRNIEMESTAFAAFCKRANIPSAIICVTLINRLNGDQINSTKEDIKRFTDNLIDFVVGFVINSSDRVK
jgi:uridine phosphorylase